MSNPRGIVKHKVNGVNCQLMVGLWAIGELEEYFDCSLDELESRLEKPRLNDVMVMFRILCECGGTELPEDFFKTMPPDEMSVMRDAISAAWEAQQEKESKGGAKKKSPKQRPGGGGKR